MHSPEHEHTVKRYDEELSHLERLVLEMGAMVKDQIRRAIAALNNRNLEAAREVIDRDHVVNGIDVVADEVTVNLLALRQPMGRDLRTVISWSKAVTDLERIGDEAGKIAHMTIALFGGHDAPPSNSLFRDVTTMSRLAVSMLQGSLDAVKYRDVEKATEVLQGDEELDGEFQSALRRLATYIMDDHRNVGHTIDVVFILKALERIGDHAKNIAEYVVYLSKGKQVRHISPNALTEALAELDAERP